MELSILLLLSIVIRNIWTNWLKPIMSGRRLRIVRGYHINGYFVAPSSKRNPDGSYYCLIAKKSNWRSLKNFLGVKTQGIKVDSWWWEPFVIKAHLHELQNPGNIFTVHARELADYAEKLINDQKIRRKEKIL